MIKVINILVGASFIFYLGALVILLFINSRGYYLANAGMMDYLIKSSNFIPFKTITVYIEAMITGSMNREIPLKNLFGNLMLLFPMGIYMPYFFKKTTRFLTFFLTMTLFIFIIEAVQLFTRTGSFDIDDFILNMIGALLGFAVWHIFLKNPVKERLALRKPA